MNLILRQILIISISFLIILWFQNIDDKKNNRQRVYFYEKIKFPILVAAIVGLLLNVPEIINYKESELITQKAGMNISDMVKPFINSNNFNKPSWFDDSKISNQQLYTDLPDF